MNLGQILRRIKTNTGSADTWVDINTHRNIESSTSDWTEVTEGFKYTGTETRDFLILHTADISGYGTGNQFTVKCSTRVTKSTDDGSSFSTAVVPDTLAGYSWALWGNIYIETESVASTGVTSLSTGDILRVEGKCTAASGIPFISGGSCPNGGGACGNEKDFRIFIRSMN